MAIEFFIYGILIGAALITTCFFMYTAAFDANTSRIVPEYLAEIPMSEFIFDYRKNHFVQATHANYRIILDMNKGRATIIDQEGNNACLYNDYNKKMIDHIYHRIITSFEREIFIDIITLNNDTVSKNLIDPSILEKSNLPDEVKSDSPDPTLDDILDKISRVGIENLTNKELEILNKLSKDDDS